MCINLRNGGTPCHLEVKDKALMRQDCLFVLRYPFGCLGSTLVNARAAVDTVVLKWSQLAGSCRASRQTTL